MNNGRLFEILYLLMEGKPSPLRHLPGGWRFPRTIYRDVEALSGAGIPIYMTKGREGESGFYRILCWRNPCFPIRNRMKSYMPCKAWRLPAACRTKRCFPE